MTYTVFFLILYLPRAILLTLLIIYQYRSILLIDVINRTFYGASEGS